MEQRGLVKGRKRKPDAMRAAIIWMQGVGQFDPVDLDPFERFLRVTLADEPGNDAQVGL